MKKTQPTSPPVLDSPPAPPTASTAPKSSLWLKVGLGIGVLVVLATFVGAVYYLLQPTTPTARIRDVFLIFLALEVFLIGLGLLILIIQLAVLLNLLQNEIQPILRSTQQTLNTVRGTTVFLSEHLVEPVLKLNEYLAMFQRVGGFFRRPSKKSPKGE